MTKRRSKARVKFITSNSRSRCICGRRTSFSTKSQAESLLKKLQEKYPTRHYELKTCTGNSTKIDIFHIVRKTDNLGLTSYSDI